MATYVELFDLRNNAVLLNKVAVAVTKKAQLLIDLATPTANQLAWANKAIVEPTGVARVLYNYVLAVNSGATVAGITAATDAAIQANVDSAVDKLIAGGII